MTSVSENFKSTVENILLSLAGTAYSKAKENADACAARRSPTHMPGPLASVDINTMEEQPGRTPQSEKCFSRMARGENFPLLPEDELEHASDESYDSDDDSLGSCSAVSSLSADQSELFEQCDVSVIHPDEQDHEQDASQAASPYRPQLPPRPNQPRRHQPTRPNLAFPPRAHRPTAPQAPRPFRVLETPPQICRSHSLHSTPSPVFRDHSQHSAASDSTSNGSDSYGHSQPRSDFKMRRSVSVGSSRPPIANNRSFESAYSQDSSLMVSSIINRGPKPNHQNFHYRRAHSEYTFNANRPAGAGLPIIATQPGAHDAIECTYRSGPVSPINKELLGTRPRRAQPPNIAIQHKRVQSNGSWSVKSMMTAESTCLSSNFSATADDENSAGIGSATYYQEQKPKAKSKNVVAEEIKYKMGKMIPSLTPVKPLGRRISSLMKGKVDGDDKIVLDRANNGFLA